MSTDFASERARLADLPRLLAAAPHRPLFFAGALVVLLNMAWWTLELAALHFGWRGWPQPTIPPRFGHAMLIQYGLFPLFMFGFLMTTFPRWMNGPLVPRSRYVAVAVLMLAGYVVANIGLLGKPMLLRAGFLLLLGGYVTGVVTLAGVLQRATDRNRHGWSALAAFGFGTLGVALFVAWLFGAPADLAWLSIRIGTWCFLVPMYFTVCHRMLPFFSKNIVGDYVMWRPTWSLWAAWLLLVARALLEWRGVTGLLWLVDVPLALLFGWHALAWQPWRCMRPGLLAVLHLAFAWLPLALVLFALQDIAWAVAGRSILGLAPLHVLAIGFFGSMLVAMVTRVTHGHSGRPLQMGPVPWLCFALLQGVLLLRVMAETASRPGLWLVMAGAGWLLAFLPWVLRFLWILATPRADGRPG